MYVDEAFCVACMGTRHGDVRWGGVSALSKVVGESGMVGGWMVGTVHLGQVGARDLSTERQVACWFL